MARIKLPLLLAALLVSIASVTVGIVGLTSHDTRTVPAPLPPSTAGTTATLVHQAAASLPDLHMRDETQPGVPAAANNARQDALEAAAHHDQLPLVSPDASPTEPGCTSAFVRDFSSRGGVRPRLLVAHYTVSHNVAGTADVWAIHNLFDTWSYQASSNFVIDAEGHCLYLVRTSDKAWAQASANPYSISIEFVAYGDEGRLSAAALKKGGQVFAHEAKLWGIPIRLGAVSNCVPTRTGIVDHAMLGLCGGGHHDIRPFYGSSAVRNPSQDAHVLAPLITATKRAAAPHAAVASGYASLNTAQKHLVDNLAKQRRKGRRPNRHHGGRWKHHPLAHKQAIKDRNAIQKAITYYAAHTKTQHQLRANRVKYLKEVLAS